MRRWPILLTCASLACILWAGALFTLEAQQPGPGAKGPALSEARNACAILKKFASGGRDAYKLAGGLLTVPFPDGTDLDAGDVIAYEEHKHFTYVVIDLAKAYGVTGKDGPSVVRRIIHWKPATFVVEDQIRVPDGTKVRWLLHPSGKVKEEFIGLVIAGEAGELAWNIVVRPEDSTRKITDSSVEWACGVKKGQARFLHVFHRRAEPTDRLSAGLRAPFEPFNLVISLNKKLCTLSLPLGRIGPGSIAFRDADDKDVVPSRILPSGVMPSGPDGVKLMERWDSAYRGKGKPGWDTGRPSSELKKLVEEGRIKPGKTIELGCGAGTNAIFLAKNGFQVTGIDVAPTGLNWAMDRAGQAKVKVRWLLGDALAPPQLEPVDFIFDRGCYHHLRRLNAPGYVETLRRYTRPGSRVLILAGNANEKPAWGPPRVKEEEIRGDFAKLFDIERLQEIHFDAVDPNAPKRALAWSILLKRK